MRVEVWPFLVSRNKKFGFRTIVAPEFLCGQGLPGLLADIAGGEVTLEEHARYREIYGSEVGDLTLVFRVVEAKSNYIGLKEDEVLTDQFGRSIDLVEGVVLRGIYPQVIVIVQDLQFVHEYVKNAYQIFWKNTENIASVQPSKPFALQRANHANEYGSTPSIKPSTPLDLPSDDLSRKSDYEKALKLDNVAAYVVRQKVSAELKQPEGTFPQTPSSPQRTLSTSTKTKKQWIDEGDLFAAGGFYRRALKAYKQALQLPPISPRDDASAYRGKGDTFFYQQDYERADQAYDQALECDDRDPLAHNGKGLIAASREDYKRAIKFYERAIKLDPNCALAYLNKGLDLRKSGAHEAEIRKAFENAVDAFNLLLQTEAKAIWYHYQIPALQELGRSSEAERAKEKARELGYRKKSLFDIDL